MQLISNCPLGPLRVRSFSIFIFSLLFSLCGTCLFAQSTNIAIGSTVIQPSVKRLGINLGTLTYYDSGQTTQNLITQNPGFEGQIWNSTIRCAWGTPSSCVDEDQWSGWPAGFWDGATFEVFYGAAAGRTGTVTDSTAPGAGQGVTLNFSSWGVAPSPGDYLIVRKTVPGGAAGGWWPSASGAGLISDNRTDLPPGTLGQQTIALAAPSASDSASLAGYFDSTSGMTFLQLNGTYQIQFKAKGTGGSNLIHLLFSRGGVSTYLNQQVALTGSWNTYNLTFTAAEDGSSIGTAGLHFSTVGADSFELDDVSLTKVNGDPTNTTIFRDPVVNALRTLQPGLIRHWGGQLGDTLDNLLTPAFGRQRSGYSAWYTESDTIDYGLHDFLQLCQLIGAEPWFVVPSTFSAADASNLIEYLAGSSSTPYGSKRAALGQSTPWTQVFTKIHLEFGNEAWNSTFKGGSIEWPVPYASRAQAIFGLMRANPSYASASFDLVLGGQAANPGAITTIQNNCNNNDSLDVAPYTMNTVDSYADTESLYGSTFAEPEALMSPSGTAEGLTPGMVYQDSQAVQSSSHPVPLSFYEINLSTLDGAITQQALNSYVPSLGAGLMVADTMLLGLRDFGVVNQQLYALPQYSFRRPDGETALLWGAVLDMGVTDRRRPQYLALQMANLALSNGASMLQTQHSGADPTWNQPFVNTVQFSGAHDLHSFAFQNGANLSAVIFNLSRNATLPVTFSGINAPSGTVQMQQLTSANPSDTNENASVVNISAAVAGPPSGLSLPPYSMTVLTWNGQVSAPPPVNPAPPVTPAPPPVIPAVPPVISGLTTSAISTGSVTVTWTTDQPATSQVQYGSSSVDLTALTTSHSVTLTELTPATTYYGTVTSVNAGGLSSASGFMFTTLAAFIPPPQLGYLAYWGISSSGIIISWSTNVPSTTAVAYGTTTALGQIDLVQSTMTWNHGAYLTGLTPNTTYYVVAQSADANGDVGSATMFSFTTLPSH